MALLLLAAVVGLQSLEQRPQHFGPNTALAIVVISSLRTGTGTARYKTFANASRSHGVPFHRLDVSPKKIGLSVLHPRF